MSAGRNLLKYLEAEKLKMNIFVQFNRYLLKRQKSQLLIAVVLLITFYLSVHLVFYRFFLSLVGDLNAYLIDQLLFFFIFIVLIVTYLTKRQLHFSKQYVLIFAVYGAFVALTLGDILERYFISDDLVVLFSHVVNPGGINYSYQQKYDFFYYPFLPFSLLFRLFHFNAFFYNLFSLFTLTLSALVFSRLLIYIGATYHFNYKHLAVLIPLVYIASPNIADGFYYIAHSTGIGYVVVITLTSLLFYLQFLENKSKLHYFLLGYVLMLILLKTATARVGFYPLCLLAIEVINFSRSQTQKVWFALRLLLLILPFYFMTDALTLGKNHIYGIGPSRFINTERLYLFFASFIPAAVPYFLWAPVIKWIRASTMESVYPPVVGLVLNNLLLFFGILFFIVVSAVICILFWRRHEIKLILVFWICSLASLIFFAFFGYGIQPLLNQTYDYSLLAYAITPGSRYYPLPLIFLLAMFYTLFLTLLGFFREKIRIRLYYITLIIVLLIISSSSIFIKMVNYLVTKSVEPRKVVSEKVLQLVPNDLQRKVLFATNGDAGQGFEYFYPWPSQPTLTYISDEKFLLSFLKKNKIFRNNFYAFYFNKYSLYFEDKSNEFRKKYENFLDN